MPTRHIDSFPEHTTYLGFRRCCNGIVKYYVNNSLPFGFATAGHIFTKTLRVLVKHWRSLGYKVIMVLDDGIGGDVSLKRLCLRVMLSGIIYRSLGSFFQRTNVQGSLLVRSPSCIFLRKDM